MDFTELPGRLGWICWKLGIIKFWRKHVQNKKFNKRLIINKALDKKIPKEVFSANRIGSHKHAQEIDQELAKSEFL